MFNLMTNVRVKFQRSAHEIAYYRNEITLDKRKQVTGSGQKPIREKTQKIFDCLNEPEALTKIEAK